MNPIRFPVQRTLRHIALFWICLLFASLNWTISPGMSSKDRSYVSAQVDPVSVRIVALSGDPAPGTDEGSGLRHFLNFDRQPSISSSGNVAFGAYLVDDARAYGLPSLWQETQAGLRLVALHDAEPPGFPGGVFSLADTNENWGNSLLPFLTFHGPDSVGLSALYQPIPNEESGIWMGADGTLQRVVGPGDPMPGTPYTFAELSLEARFSQSRMAFVVSHHQSADSPIPSRGGGIFSGPPGNLAPGALYGAQMSGQAQDVVFREFGLTILSPTGDVVYRGAGTDNILPGPGTLSGKGLYRNSTLIANLDGASLLSRYTFNRSGKLAFATAVDTDNPFTIWVQTDAGLRAAVTAGDPAPNAMGQPSGATFSGLGKFWLLDSGYIVLVASDSNGNTGIWAENESGLYRLLIEGDPAPGTGRDFARIEDAIPNNAGQVAFFSHSPALGYWVVDARGRVQKRLGPNDAIEVKPGDIRRASTVAQNRLTNGAHDGLPVHFNDRGELVLHVLFDGGSQAVVVSSGESATFVVNSTGGEVDQIPGDGVCDTGIANVEGAPQCTLRAAIEENNAGSGVGTIWFNIPDADPGRNAERGEFRIMGTLPAITRPITIDATTQPGPEDWFGQAMLRIEVNSSIVIQSGNSTIRGLAIAHAPGPGILLQGGGNNRILGSYVGTNVVGKLSLGNHESGIVIENSANNIIGGPRTTPGSFQTPDDLGNLIGGNRASGVVIRGAGSTGNHILGNRIGFDDPSLGNWEAGILIEQEASNNRVGGDTPDEANTIAFNLQDGIRVVSGVGNQVLINAIYDNTGLGIDLGGDGLNVPGSDGAGPNLRQAAPVIRELDTRGTTAVTGTLSSRPNTDFTLRFYANRRLDTPWVGQGETYVDSTVVRTDGEGKASFRVTLAGTQRRVTATATDPAGNTSEFSRYAVLHSVEFTQVIQEWQVLDAFVDHLAANHNRPPVPLVAHRPVVLRLYPHQVQQNGGVYVEITSPQNPITPPDRQESYLRSACLPLDYRRGGCSSLDFYFARPPNGVWPVTVTVRDAEQRILEQHTFDLRSTESNPLILNAVRVCHTPRVCGDVALLPGMAGLLGTLAPTHAVQMRLSPYWVVRNISAYDGNGDGRIDSREAQNWWFDTVRDINSYRLLPRPGATAGEYFYGVVSPDLPGNMGGVSFDIPGFAGMSRSSTVRMGQEVNQETLAHEVGHMLGRPHTNLEAPPALIPPGCYNLARDPGTDWPYADNTIQSGPAANPRHEVGFNLHTRRPVLPEVHFEILSYCVPRWIAPMSYRGMMHVLNPPAVAPVAATPHNSAGDYWLLSGELDPEGIRFRPLFEFDVPGDLGSGQGDYRIEVRDGNQMVLFTRRFEPAEPHVEIGPGEEAPEFNPVFMELIPVYEGAAQLVVLDEEDRQLGILDLGGAAPSVVLDPMQDALPLMGNYTVRWSAVDTDSTDVAFWLQYSPNDGQTWYSLAPYYVENELEIDFDLLPGSETARLRVLASDGVNTGVVVSSPFPVARKLPQADILFPPDEEVYIEDDLVWLQGYGYDPDDGTLADRSLQWSSDVDGSLGEGKSLPVGMLSLGTHRLTLTVSDSDGNQDSDSITIVVQAPVTNTGGIYLPAVFNN